MFYYFLLAFFIVTIIIAVYWFCFRDNDKKKRHRADDNINKSAGVFDQAARDALAELNQIENPTAGDRFRRGTINRYNVLEGNINRRNRGRIGRIVQDYTQALIDIRQDQRQGRADGIRPDFMIDQIAGFRMDLGDWEIDDNEAALIMNFDHALTTHGPVARADAITQRKREAVNNAETRAEAIDAYFDAATNYTNDAQNVHDKKVNSDLKRTLKKLRRDGEPDTNRAIAEARRYINGEYSRDPLNRDKAKRALQVLDQVAKNEMISTFNDREGDIFAVTWNRHKHPRNTRNADLMCEAVVNALADSIEKGSQVCINGRCGRVLNSLVKLDFDDDVNSGAMTYEAYKNQIFQETKAILNKEIDRAIASGNPKLKAVGESYETGSTDIDLDTEDRFKLDVKEKIDANLEMYTEKLDKTELNNIKEECYVYAAF